MTQFIFHTKNITSNAEHLNNEKLFNIFEALTVNGTMLVLRERDFLIEDSTYDKNVVCMFNSDDPQSQSDCYFSGCVLSEEHDVISLKKAMEADAVYAIIAKYVEENVHVYCFDGIVAQRALRIGMTQQKNFVEAITTLQDLIEKLDIQVIEVSTLPVDVAQWCSRREYEYGYRLDWITSDGEFKRYYSVTNAGEMPPKELHDFLRSIDRNIKDKLETIVNPKLVSEEYMLLDYNVHVKPTKNTTGFNNHYKRI